MFRVAQLAAGQWDRVLGALGVGPEYLRNKHGPCPICGGKDRFRFDNKDGRGMYFCSGCGAGTGYKLALLATGYEPRRLNQEIRRILGGSHTPTRRASTPRPSRAAAILAEGLPLTGTDPVSEYLQGRHLDLPPVTPLLHHPGLAYWHDGARAGTYPAMLAPIIGPEGGLRTVHVTYLDGGRKAPVPSPRKIISAVGRGAAVQLMPRGLVLGIAEGIETALAAWHLFGVSTWAAISAGGLETWEPVGPTREVVVYGDNDASQAGQAAAYALAKRLRASGIFANVALPDTEGWDWCDVWTRRGEAK